MDFVSYIRDQSEKLTLRDYIVHLWHELEENPTESDITSNAVTDFNNHLPVLLDQFWEVAVEKLTENAPLDEMDEDLKTYLLVLIYHCITQCHESVSPNCVLYASQVYLSLLTTPQSDDFFKPKLYRGILTTLQTSMEITASGLTSQLMYKFRNFLTKSKLNLPDLEITLATLLQIIFVECKQVHKDFEVTTNCGSVAQEALLCLKVLLTKETVSARKFLITTYLFNGLRKQSAVHLSPSHFNAVQGNLRQLLKSLHHKFKEDKYKVFLNAFIHVWKHPDFCYFGEAVHIMNGLKEKHYRTLIDILIKMMTTKNPPKNLFALSLTIICLPPKYIPVEKIKVTNEILLRRILLNCISSKSSAAVEALGEILLSPDLQKDYVKEPMRETLSCCHESTLNVPTILHGLQSLVTKKWTNRSKNKNLFVITISIMLLCEEDYPEQYREILGLLGEEASPFDLKQYVALLSETYLKFMKKEHTFSALQVLKLIFKMALHPMASSTEFVKYLYMAMVCPAVCKGPPIKSELFIDSIISDEFNYGEYFQKCHTLGLIKTEHVAKLLANVSSLNESQMKLLCATVHLTDYKQISLIADHINERFMTICNNRDLNYLFYIYDKIYKSNTSAMRLHQNLHSHEIVLNFIKFHLLEQSFQWNCVANAFALLKTLEEFTDLAADFQRLKDSYERRLETTLQTRGDFLPLLYYSQLVIFGKIVPSEHNLLALGNFLRLCSNEVHQRSPEFNLKLYVGCLLLYTNVAVVKTNLVDDCLQFLQSGLNCALTTVKLASLNMYFDVCNMLTHNFEDLIKYMFNELVLGDSVFKKTCLLKIDSLIRDDYLKLELEQFLIFVAVLGDRNVSLSDYAKQLMAENFLISNSSVIAKYFVPLIIHMAGYRRHHLYQIDDYEIVHTAVKNILDRRKVYILLLNSLPVKAKFNILSVLSLNILEKTMKGVIKFDDGYWKMIKDSIFVFKHITSISSDDDSGDQFYKKTSGQISKYILQKNEYSEKRQYPEYQKEIAQGTETLLKLLLFNESDSIQKHIRVSVFDAIMHWTSYLLPDLVYAVHVDRLKEIQNSYMKFDRFYKTHGETLKVAEESFEDGTTVSSSSFCSTTLFPICEEYVPEFGTN